MEEKDRGNAATPIIMILERRTQRQPDLSSAEVMQILRKRATKGVRRESDQDSP